MKILDMKTMFGFMGVSVSTITFVLGLVSTGMQVLIGLGSLVLLYYSINHKIIQIKNDSKKTKK